MKNAYNEEKKILEVALTWFSRPKTIKLKCMTNLSNFLLGEERSKVTLYTVLKRESSIITKTHLLCEIVVMEIVAEILLLAVAVTPRMC